MSYASAFESIQPDCFDKLASEAAFAQIALFKIRHNDYQSEINDALSASAADATQSGTLPGITVEVMMPSLAVEDKDAADPVFRVTQKFIVKENHTICFAPDDSGAGISAESLAQQIVQTFHGWYAGGFLQGWFGDTDAVIFTPDFHPLVAYEVTIHAVMDAGNLTATPSPTIAIATGEVTLACPLGGASIYYTLDGSFPGQGNVGIKRDGSTGTAVLYSAPFAVESGQQIRAAAYATGLVGSVVQQQIAP